MNANVVTRLVHARRPVETAVRGQPVEEPLPERALVRLDRLPADALDVLDARDEAGEQLVRERSRLETGADGLVRRGAHLVRPPACGDRLAHEPEAQVRAVELVRRAEQHVDAEVGDVDRPVRAVVHGVRPGERSDALRELDDARDIGERADGVRRERERDDARAVGELPLEVVVVERRVVVQLDEADLQVEVVRELEPRRDVAVVVELRARGSRRPRGTSARPRA